MPAQMLTNGLVKLYNFINGFVGFGENLSEVDFVYQFKAYIAVFISQNNVYYVLGFFALPLGTFVILLFNYVFFSIGTQLFS